MNIREIIVAVPHTIAHSLYAPFEYEPHKRALTDIQFDNRCPGCVLERKTDTLITKWTHRSRRARTRLIRLELEKCAAELYALLNDGGEK